MKVNPNIILNTVEGKPLKADKDGAVVDMTLGMAASVGLLEVHPGEQPDPPQRAFERWELARKFRTATDEVELTTEQATLTKECVCRHYGPAVAGPVIAAIEGKE